jgi:hypothetical protein
MEIREEHKALLKILGLKEEDFELFDDKFVRYEYDEEKGVRLYDPYYETSMPPTRRSVSPEPAHRKRFRMKSQRPSRKNLARKQGLIPDKVFPADCETSL